MEIKGKEPFDGTIRFSELNKEIFHGKNRELEEKENDPLKKFVDSKLHQKKIDDRKQKEMIDELEVLQDLKTKKQDYEDKISKMDQQISSMKEENNIVEGSQEEADYFLVVKKNNKEELTADEEKKLTEIENISQYENIVKMEANKSDYSREIEDSNYKHSDGTPGLKSQIERQMKKVVSTSIEANKDGSMEKVNDAIKTAMEEMGKQTKEQNLLEVSDLTPIIEMVEKINGSSNAKVTEENLKGNNIDELR